MLVRRVVLVVGLALLLALPLAGCGSYKPRLHMNVTVGPKAHQAAIRIKAVGGLPGQTYVYMGIVLTCPNGHRRLLSSRDWGHDDLEYQELDGLPRGIYKLTAYAVPGRTSDELMKHGVDRGFKPFPVGEMVNKNIVASTTFVVP